MIAMNCSFSGNTASGCSVCSSMVCASSFFTAVTPFQLEAALRGGAQRAFDREHRVVGAEGAAIVEAHALAQLEAPGQRAGGLP